MHTGVRNPGTGIIDLLDGHATNVAEDDSGVKKMCEGWAEPIVGSHEHRASVQQYQVKALFERVPMKEIAKPEWIARGVVFLASDESRYMTGEVLVMDGGYRMDGSLPGAAYWEE